ncbi:MAG: hypothetical protein ACQEVA_10155 [Myxococcota bacterium]
MMRYKHTIFLVFLTAAFAVTPACGPDDGTDGSALEGLGQKGPFEQGNATATATALSDSGEATNDTREATVEEGGAFTFAELDWSGPTRITVSGAFYDEIEGATASESLSLDAFARIGDGAVDSNVNFFTHLHAARTVHLMGQGTTAADADAQADDELATLISIGTDPRELNIFAGLDVANGDDRQLLNFSVALLQTDMTQEDIDTIAADFADDGELNGDGDSLFGELEDAIDASSFDQTVTDAADNLRADFPDQVEDGNGEDENGDGDDPVDLEPDCNGGGSVICPGDPLETSVEPGGAGELQLYTTFPGSYSIVASFEESSSFNGWYLFEDDGYSFEVGSATDRTLAEGVTDVRLSEEKTYYLRLDNGTSTNNAVTVSSTRVSDGRANDPIEILVGQPFDGIAGTNNSVRNFTSYYAFTTQDAGAYGVDISGFVCGSGSQGVTAALIEADTATEAFDGASSSIDRQSADGDCSVNLQGTLEAATTYYLEVVNMNNRSLEGLTGETYEVLVSSP